MGIRDALDSELSLITATTLHTVGAIAIVAALVTHIAWYRKLRHGIDSEALRRATFILTVNGVLANLVGGFMRTYLPGHPGIADTAASPWVQVMLLKHAFIFAALGAMVYLDQIVAPRLRRLAKGDGLPDRTPTGHAVGAYIVVTGVLVASVLGGMAQITPLGEEFEDHGGPDMTHETVVEADGRPVRYVNATGTLTSIPPLLPQTVQGTFDVGTTITQLGATLVWSDPAASLRVCLVAPDGTETCDPGAPLPGPTPGGWTYRIEGDGAVNVAWELSLRQASVAGDETLLVETVTVAPGSFFEINTEMPEGETLWWDWSSAAAVAFDVHSHFGGEAQYYVEKSTDADKGSYTNERAGGYSLLWANEGSTPISLTYRVWGDLEVDSYFPPR